MFSLPAAKRTWKCGYRWDYDLEESIDTGEGCGQRIYQSTTEKYESGKYAVLNDENGIGGLMHQYHKCPKRVGSRFHHFTELDKKKYEQQLREKLCTSCLNYYDSIRCPLCPTCFKLECTHCHSFRQWINNERTLIKKLDQGQDTIAYTIIEDTSKTLIENELCKECGHRSFDVRQVWNSFQRAHGKYEY